MVQISPILKLATTGIAIFGQSLHRTIPVARVGLDPFRDISKAEQYRMNSDIQRYRDNWRDELNGAALYEALAAAEADPIRKDLFMQLGQAESSHATLWRDKLTAAGVGEAKFVPDFRTRLLVKLTRRFGP